MSLTDGTGLSATDIMALTGNNDGFGNSGMGGWWIILFILLLFGGFNALIFLRRIFSGKHFLVFLGGRKYFSAFFTFPAPFNVDLLSYKNTRFTSSKKY